MQSKGNSPTAAQKRFWNELTSMGCLLTGRPAEIDHLVGASAQSNGENIGNWIVIALSPELHRLGQANRTNKAYLFQEKYCNEKLWTNYKKELFFAQIVYYCNYYKKECPVPPSVIYSYMRY